MPWLNFIDDKELESHVLAILEKIKVQNAQQLVSRKNKLDPFSALFEAFYNQQSIDQWYIAERTRQIQKTVQNAIGTFHQNIIGSMYGWENLRTGKQVDVVNHERKIFAEIKNKFNTTKGSDKSGIYEELLANLDSYQDYTAYYVEIIPSGQEPYNKIFTPSDRMIKSRKVENEKIRIIDGYSFYELAANQKDALYKLYITLPLIIEKYLVRNTKTLLDEREKYLYINSFVNIFIEAYPWVKI